ncbi:MAG: hypothetical protein ACE5H3_11635 [Planctomycetota bacterium]
MRLWIPLLLLALTGMTLRDWWKQRAAAQALAERQASQAARPAPPPPDSSWLPPLFGAPPQAPARAELRTRLEAWGRTGFGGRPEILDGPDAARAARAELARWLELRPSAGKAERFDVVPTPDGRAVEIRLELSGPPASLFPWLTHLLSQPPGAGYWTDPLRLRLEGEPDGMRADLALRVVPAEGLLPPPGQQEPSEYPRPR